MALQTLFCLCCILAVFSQDIVIDTQLGKIRGTVHKPVGKQTSYQFYGIQYGIAPVGNLRFRPAQLNTSTWNGIYDGTKFGNVCMQNNPPNGQPMSEDCLFLNIYTPKPNNTGTLLPVFFWIHGGGFEAGAGSAAFSDATNLVGVGRDFVYVSINYRLGVFGFLSNKQLYDEDANWKSYGGLNGIYDQIQALNWVNKYISDYGGDPKQVTIFGESAGGLSVCNLCISPLASGLFNRGIIESGACVGPWGSANTSYGLFFSNTQLEDAGYPINNISYLRSIPAQEFQNKMSSSLWVTAADGMVLKDRPVNIYSDLKNKDNVFNVDKLIIGFNTMDGIIGWPWHGGPRPTNTNQYKKMIAQYVVNETQQNLLYSYYYPITDFSPYPPDHNSVEIAWFTMNGDVCLTCPSLLLGNEVDEQLNDNIIYMYQFGGPGKNGSYYASHGSELPFVYDDAGGTVIFDMPFNQLLANEMVSAWTNFAKYGIPNVTDSINKIDIEWNVFGGNTKSNVIIFEDTVKIKSSFQQTYRKNVCDFWFNQVGVDEMTDICIDGFLNNETTTTPPNEIVN